MTEAGAAGEAAGGIGMRPPEPPKNTDLNAWRHGRTWKAVIATIGFVVAMLALGLLAALIGAGL